MTQILRTQILHGFFLLLMLAACNKPKQLAPAYYHWQTNFQNNRTQYLTDLGCRKLYIKFLDIGPDENGAPVPYAKLNVSDSTGLDIVPCVFITQQVFHNLSEANIDKLAANTARSLASIGKQFPGKTYNEVQFDCDWTPRSRQGFFLFLEKIKQHLPGNTTLSATIRLHQYKFPEKTGVPPVDRGMLMLYNTGDIENPEGGNSIFTAETANTYIQGAPERYPLPLDVAVAVYAWTLVYRDGLFWKILPDVGDELQDTTRFLREAQTPPHCERYKVISGTFLAGHYLRPEDQLRLETIDPELLSDALKLLPQIDLASDATLAFFHLDSSAVVRFPAATLQNLCDSLAYPLKAR
ncbi:MAG: hypothetical protein IT270_08135 [Saprospiraceae bacterium]|nr:hypothetical protein [Saprospiraceae bacterium]